MHLTISNTTLDYLKDNLRASVPGTGASLRMEGMARGCGFNTYAGMRERLARGATSVSVNDATFLSFLGHPDVEVGPRDRTLSHAIARSMLKPVLDQQSTLTERGFDSIWRGGPEEQRKSRDERTELLAARRAETYRSAWAVDQFELSLIYLSRQERIKSANRKIGSYGLKHRAENLSRKFGLFTHLGDYVSNGMLLAAAYASGFSVTPDGGDSLNGSLNISMRTVNLAWGRNRRNRHGDLDKDADVEQVLAMYGEGSPVNG